MKVVVRLFAGHRERAGTDRLELELPDDATAGSAFRAVALAHPAIAETESFTTLARNREVVDHSARLFEGDEVALLQPASGG